MNELDRWLLWGMLISFIVLVIALSCWFAENER